MISVPRLSSKHVCIQLYNRGHAIFHRRNTKVHERDRMSKITRIEVRIEVYTCAHTCIYTHVKYEPLIYIYVHICRLMGENGCRTERERERERERCFGMIWWRLLAVVFFFIAGSGAVKCSAVRCRHTRI